MRAHVDMEGVNPFKIAGIIYSATFLREIGEKYGFDGANPKTAARLRDIAGRYIWHRHLESLPDERKQLAKHYLAIQKNTAALLNVLEPIQEVWIQTE